MCLMGDDLTPITFGQSLFCGMADCDSRTTVGLLERDERLPGLFRLLPICPDCLNGLRERSSEDSTPS